MADCDCGDCGDCNCGCCDCGSCDCCDCGSCDCCDCGSCDCCDCCTNCCDCNCGNCTCSFLCCQNFLSSFFEFCTICCTDSCSSNGNKPLYTVTQSAQPAIPPNGPVVSQPAPTGFPGQFTASASQNIDQPPSYNEAMNK